MATSFFVKAKPGYRPRFYLFFCQTKTFFEQFEDKKTGIIGGVSLNKFGSIEIKAPVLEEQKRIVSILNKAFEGLDRAHENAEANLVNSRELFDRTVNSQLTTYSEAKHVKLGEVASIQSTLVDPKLPDFLDQTHIGAGNMVTGRDVLINLKTSREEGLKSGK